MTDINSYIIGLKSSWIQEKENTLKQKFTHHVVTL